ncbi:head-tail adaptor protein [Neorhizobium galegae]|uniref:head-tail adaptor protein n=1 Tax=Neorhizobium galegae TaxID=399 RepID=UPI001F3F106B|nr:head-tail adaptor protein [Neorhizobium galegae]UIK05009.1 head-tail adaptor protein [Neorhizobium galegae]
MSPASNLNQRVAFDALVRSPDGHGGTTTGWGAPEAAVMAWAHFRYLRGGEAVQAARLAGRQPMVVTIRKSAAAAQITNDWRMRDVCTGAIYNIRAIVPTDDRGFLELTVEGGVAV